MPEPEPRPSELRRLLKRPDARPRVSRAIASLLAASIIAIAIMGALIIWHLVRRGRLIRESLGPPRPVRWTSLETAPTEPNAEIRDQEDTNEHETERNES